MKLVIPFLVVLALVGAAGLSSLKSGDYCEYDAANPDFATVSTDLGATPPGPRCVYRHADGRVTSVSTGSWPWFAIALAGFAAIALWTVGARAAAPPALPPRLASPWRRSAHSGSRAAALSPAACSAFRSRGCRTSRSHAPTTGAASRARSVSVGFLAGVAVFVAAVLSTALEPVAAAAFAVALAALSARLLKPRPAATAAPPRRAPDAEPLGLRELGARRGARHDVVGLLRHRCW